MIKRFLSQFFISPLLFAAEGEGGAGGNAAAAGGSGEAGAAGNGAGAAGAAGGTPPSFNYVDQSGKFTDDFKKAHPEMSKFSEFTSLVKSYSSLQQMLGKQGKVVVPGENAPPEEVEAFRRAIGVPDTVDGYGIKKLDQLDGKPLPQGLWEEAKIDDYVKKFHELGIPPKAAKEIIEFGLRQGVTRIGDMQALIDKGKVEGEKALKMEWGDKFEANVAQAEVGAAALGITKEVFEKDPALANNPNFIRAMQKVAAMLPEGQSPGARGSGNLQTDPTPRIKELQALMAHRDYRNRPEYAQHEENVGELRRLIELRYRMQGRG